MRGMDGVRALTVPLPEDIARAKLAGDLEEAVAAIDARLARPLPEMLRLRLLVEKERLRRVARQYPWNRAEALQRLRELLPDATDAELTDLEQRGLVESIYLKGEKRYFVRFHKSLLKVPALQRRAEPEANGTSPYLDPMIAAIGKNGRLARRITLESSISVAEDAFVPGRYRAWLPYAAESAQQRDIQLLEGNPDYLSDAHAPARTAFWERELTQPETFSIRYRYVSEIRYADPLHQPAPAQPLYPNALPPTEADLAEDGVFIRFTPYLRSLAADICRGETTDAGRAHAIYQWITIQVQYSFMPAYFQIDHIGEYCAVNLKGDCGLQAILFVNLCRIAGIPARWQSGCSIGAASVGSHDWAQFYLPGWGWLFADPSYGGGAFRAGARERHAFYFSNLDPMRLVANRAFMAELDPPMEHFRLDPYDNQDGELERVEAPEALLGNEVETDVRLIEVEELP